MRRGCVVTITGPSGVGKTTIVRQLMQLFPSEFSEAISHTTRNPRQGEIDGVDYYYITPERFAKMETNGDFLEVVKFDDRQYGSSRQEADIKTRGKNALVVVEPHGVEQWRNNYDGPLVAVKVKPPDTESLRDRMAIQGRDPGFIEKRLQHDKLVFGTDSIEYNLTVINDDIQQTVATIREYVRSCAISVSS